VRIVIDQKDGCRHGSSHRWAGATLEIRWDVLAR
jgi:hypothetical protein